MLCLLGIVLVLVSVYLSSNRNFDQLFNCLVVLAVLLAGAMLSQPSGSKESFLGHAPVEHKMGKCDGKLLKAEDALTQYENVSWEGRRLNFKKENGKHTWRGPKGNVPLMKESVIYSPVGDGYKLGEDPTSANFPTVDGQEGSHRHMFMLARNQASPDCCPSTYSTDTGCICTTEQQRDFIAGRGGNMGNGNDMNI